MKKILPQLFLSVFFLLFVIQIHAQEELQVVSQTILKSVDFEKNDKIFIDGKKAEIIVSTWDKEEVKVLLKIKSKHPVKSIAEADLKKAVHVIEKIEDKIYIKNDLNAELTKPESAITARYQILIPTYASLTLKNNFGKTNVEEIVGNLNIEGEYSQIRLNNVKGDVNITSYFGDIEAQYISGQVSIDSKRSNIEMSELSGAFDIKAKYAVIKVNANQQLIDLNIDAERSDVIYNPILGSKIYYNLLAEYGKISVPKEIDFNFLENSAATKKAISGSNQNMSSIKINTTFGDIKIGQ